MAKKIGICRNIDCDNYKKTIEVEPGGEFECPLCHQPLQEAEGGRKRKVKDEDGGDKKPWRIIGAIVVVAALAGGGYYFMGNSPKDKDNVPVVDSTAVDVQKEKVPAEDTVQIDSSELDVPPVEEATEEPKKKDPTPVLINGRGTVDLGYATYTGDLKNGKPHGYGKLTYKTSRKIVSSKDFVASPGDTFEGEFRDGKISGLGYWKHDGNETAVKP